MLIDIVSRNTTHNFESRIYFWGISVWQWNKIFWGISVRQWNKITQNPQRCTFSSRPSRTWSARRRAPRPGRYTSLSSSHNIYFGQVFMQHMETASPAPPPHYNQPHSPRLRSQVLEFSCFLHFLLFFRWILSKSMSEAPEVFIRAAARWRNPN